MRAIVLESQARRRSQPMHGCVAVTYNPSAGTGADMIAYINGTACTLVDGDTGSFTERMAWLQATLALLTPRAEKGHLVTLCYLRISKPIIASKLLEHHLLPSRVGHSGCGR